MSTPQGRWISRKEIASITQLSVDVIRRNEERLGLAQCKVIINERNVCYNRQQAVSNLTDLHIIPQVATSGTQCSIET